MVIVAVIMMLVLGAVLGLGLGVADKYLKVEADVRVEKVTSLLPGYNCGGVDSLDVVVWLKPWYQVIWIISHVNLVKQKSVKKSLIT